MKCANCGYDFIQKNPEMCPSCGGKEIVSDEQLIERYMQSERYEDAALLYEELEMFDKAEECRKKANPNYVKPASPVGKISGVDLECPHCNKVQSVSSRKNEAVCIYCSKKYAIPEKVFDLF